MDKGLFSLSRGLVLLFQAGILVCILSACASTPPSRSDNLCHIFEEKPKWYRAALKSAKKWGAPVYMPMAIMYHESGFRAKAKPPMKYFFGVIPTGRASSAYGYPQALDSTWAEYERETGSQFKQRDNFAHAYDFIQWYIDKTARVNGVSKLDAANQYLNYHEGLGGFSRGTYANKQWLLNLSKRVEARANRYAQQLATCQSSLKKERWLGLF